MRRFIRLRSRDSSAVNTKVAANDVVFVVKDDVVTGVVAGNASQSAIRDLPVASLVGPSASFPLVVTMIMAPGLDVPEGYEEQFAGPNPAPLGFLVAIAGYGNLDGLYLGQSGSTPEELKPLKKVSTLDAYGAIIAAVKIGDNFNGLDEGPFLIMRNFGGVWQEAISLTPAG